MAHRFGLGAASFAALLLIGTGSADAAQGLAALKWKARPVVVLADGPADPRFRRQIAALEAAGAALRDYDVRIVRAAPADAALRRALGVPGTGFAVVLVGKDGGVKESWREPVEPARIFGLIDTMPMRQDEVDRRK